MLEIRDGDELDSMLVYPSSLMMVPTPSIYISKHASVRVSLMTESEMDMDAKGFKLRYKEGKLIRHFSFVRVGIVKITSCFNWSSN